MPIANNEGKKITEDISFLNNINITNFATATYKII